MKKLIFKADKLYARYYSIFGNQQVRLFYHSYPSEEIQQTLSGELTEPLRQPNPQSVPAELALI